MGGCGGECREDCVAGRLVPMEIPGAEMAPAPGARGCHVAVELSLLFLLASVCWVEVLSRGNSRRPNQWVLYLFQATLARTMKVLCGCCRLLGNPSSPWGN